MSRYDTGMQALRTKLNELVAGLLKNGRPARTELAAAAADIRAWKTEHQVAGLWESPPLMVTATIDDAMGHGLDLIHQYAGIAGLQVHALGLLQPAEAIIAACRNLEPVLLGLTILQFDSEDDLSRIAREIPGTTRIVAGGPVFKGDPDFARRTCVHRVAADAADFLEYILVTFP